MKDVGHSVTALLFQVENGQLIFAIRSVLLSERVVTQASPPFQRAPLIGVRRRRRAIAASHATWALPGHRPPICFQVDSELRMRCCGPDKERLPDATRVTKAS